MAFKQVPPEQTEDQLKQAAFKDFAAGKFENVVKLCQKVGYEVAAIYLTNFMRGELDKTKQPREIESRRESYIAAFRKMKNESRLNDLYKELLRLEDPSLIPHIYSLADVNKLLSDPKNRKAVVMIGADWCHNCPHSYPKLKETLFKEGVAAYYLDVTKEKSEDTLNLIKHYDKKHGELNYPTFIIKNDQKIEVTEGYFEIAEKR